jgi:hypothetical protein
MPHLLIAGEPPELKRIARPETVKQRHLTSTRVVRVVLCYPSRLRSGSGPHLLLTSSLASFGEDKLNGSLRSASDPQEQC